MDALFRKLKPGEEAKVKVVFADPEENMLIGSDIFDIRNGSLYFYTQTGYFRLDSVGRVYSSPDGGEEIDLEASAGRLGHPRVAYQQIRIFPDRIRVGYAFSKPLDLTEQYIRSKNEHTGYFVVKFSEDFDGEVTGWKSNRGW